jgi:hypothetical protein
MSYHLTITEQPSYLHATSTGTHTPENAARFLKEAYEACVQRGYSDLLLEMNQSGPSLEMTRIVEVITERSADGLKLRKIAYVDTSSRDPDRKRFAVSLAIKQGVNARMFRDLDEAKRWMLEG